jgi:thiamine biosynthesis lipoprotein ApbE
MSVNPSVESNFKKQVFGSFQQFEREHKEEITAVSLIVAKITNRSLEEVKPHLDTMLSELVESNSSSASTSDFKRFNEITVVHPSNIFP